MMRFQPVAHIGNSTETTLKRKQKSRRERAQDVQVARELAAHAETLSPRLLAVTTGIYQPNPREMPELVGSGVLLALGQARFLITAGHVLDFRLKGQLIVGVSPELLSVAGQVTRLRSPNARSDAEDHVDLGLVRLEGGAWDEIALERFASWSDLDVRVPVMARHTYGLVGFPQSKNRHPVEADRIIGVAFRMAGMESPEESYRETGTNPEVNVMVGFDKKAMWGRDGIHHTPDLYGASGAGLWRYGRRLREARTPPKLSAIAVEWHKSGRNKHILGTRIHLAIAALVDKYDDVQAFVSQQLQGNA